MRLAVEVLFRTHVYSFKGNLYRQADGGPIGLRATCAIARVCMAQHSVMWQNRMKDSNINIAGSGFYVDDGRVFMHPLRPGWRWTEDGLWYCREWELEDESLSNIEITKRAVGKSMDGMIECLTFTVESQEDFENDWLPTLDLNIRVDKENVINYMFFEKPTTSQVCLQESTALSRNSMIQSLAEDTKRRLMNTSAKVPDTVRVEIIDKWAQKLVNSGHKVKDVRAILISGIKGFYIKVRKCKREGVPLHRSAKMSSGARR